MVTLARRLMALPLGLALAGGPALASSTNDPCAGLKPPPSMPAGPKRAPTVEDLIQLRDVGWIDGRLVGNPPMSVSPEGRRFAFHLRQASLATGGYCLGIFVMDIKSGARPRQVDAGGELVLETISIAGMEEFPSGSPKVITPRWSPDGKWLLYLRRDNGVTQAWHVPAEGGTAAPVTHSRADVKDAEWLEDGRSIVFSSRPSLLRFYESVERERSQGWLYDNRFFPPGGLEPNPVPPLPIEYFVADIESGSVRDATEAEAERLLRRPSGRSTKALIEAKSYQDDRAWTEQVDPDRLFSPTRLRVSLDGEEFVCTEAICADGIRGLWWLDDGHLLILRNEDRGRGTIGFYRWRPGRGMPQRVLRTTDRLIGCQRTSGQRLLCAHETSTHPRYFALFDPTSGGIEPLLDLNPEMTRVRLSPVRRLVWRNAFGTETYGDLVLPPDHKVGEQHPMIVMPYASKGFLRGGTSNENPIQLLAARGFAVLSFQRPSEHYDTITASNREEFSKALLDDWWDRRQVLSSLEAGIELIDELGLIDVRKVGITGLSDGAGTAWFSLINSNLFAAAALSTCCQESSWHEGLNGPGYEEEFRRYGYLASGEPGFKAFWQPYALSMNAHLPTVPILIEAADREMLMATHTYSKLRAAGWPIEMFVFAGEMHNKVWPRHRAAIYRRNMDWFDYWLRNVRDPAPEKDEQYRRWDALPRPTRKPGVGGLP